MLKIATAHSRFEKKWKNSTISWDDLVERLGKATRTQESFAEYQAAPKDKQGNIKDVGGFVGGHLKAGTRKRGHVLSRSLITLDIDHGEPDVWLTLLETVTWKACAYTTHSHSPEHPRIRLVLPLSRTVSEEEYAPLARAIAAKVGIDFFDDTTYEAHRLMYWPSHSHDAEYVCQTFDGDVIDVDEVLAEYDDWTDATTWPLSSRQLQPPRLSGVKAADPTGKSGVVGAFCRAYDVPGAIREFLPDVYVETLTPGRWTYTGGHTSGGAIVYGEGRFLYSHHSTDPAGGRACNAFDLVRIHTHGELDEGKPEGIAIHDLPSYKEMCSWASNLPAVKRELLVEVAAEFAHEQVVNVLELLENDRKGAPKATLENLITILERDHRLQGIRFDELWNTVTVSDVLPWARPQVPWRDVDDAHLSVYLEENYVRFTERDMRTALAAVADRRKYHPVRDYLRSLPRWDGVERLETLFIDYLGAEDTAYVRAATRKLFVAAVRRVLQPGCKFDSMIVLVGPQGIGKSTIIARMGKEWFNDSLSLADTKDKTAAEKLQGFWIHEFGEMAGMNKAEVEAMRSFITRQDDIYRGAYERRVSRHPRQCVFLGTTNAENGFLTDPAGNRRMWPVNVPGGSEKHAWDLTDAMVDKLWAEALHLNTQGEKLYLEGEVLAEAERRQRDAIAADERLGLVEEYLNTPLPADWFERSIIERKGFIRSGEDFLGTSEVGEPRQSVCVAEIWCEAFGKERADLNRRESFAISNMLKKLGWVAGAKTQWVKWYGSQKIYTRDLTKGVKNLTSGNFS